MSHKLYFATSSDYIGKYCQYMSFVLGFFVYERGNINDSNYEHFNA